ncbi:hypothetical protein [Janibacter sp. UYMM211]|uniref:hypothetical protein n=1 Tax=Janibacter sp. UYMM211 TaxID=3156342 RepID=UPI003396A6FD
MSDAMPVRVVVCDDDVARAAKWSRRIQEVDDRLEVSALSGDDFGRTVGQLKARKIRAKRQGASSAEIMGEALGIDTADVLVVDSDLTPDAVTDVEDGSAVMEHLVGELGGEVAHLARCYSDAGAIVVVNQKWRHRAFDLTMRDIADEVADVYVSEDDIDNPALWSPLAPNPEGFRPWHWPDLRALPGQIADVLGRVDPETPVRDLLDITEGDLNMLTGRQLEALGLEDLTTGTTLTAVAQDSAYGLRLKEGASPQQKVRVAVFGLRRWLDREVLNAQNVFVDMPHLLVRQPWRVPGREDMDTWNAAAAWWDLSGAAVDAPVVAGASCLLGRPVWRWADVSALGPGGARSRREDPVFCEDTSRFESADHAKDYFSDVDGPWAQRYVAEIADVDYHPRRRLLV